MARRLPSKAWHVHKEGQAGHAEDRVGPQAAAAVITAALWQPAGSSNLPALCASSLRLRNQDTTPSAYAAPDFTQDRPTQATGTALQVRP